MPELWRIGQLAERTGVPAKTIRYYEQLGLLAPAERTAAGYRLYDRTALARLGFIRKAQQLGLALAEIRSIARLRDGGVDPCVHVVALLDKQIERAEEAESRLHEFVRELRRLRATADRQRKRSGSAVCGIIEHKAAGIDARGILQFLAPASKR
jgi:DNA-binding transcriptional MerR regulator